MPKEKIPVNKISDKLRGRTFFFSYFPDKEYPSSGIERVHRDDYYVFLFALSGKIKFLIDFEECEITSDSLVYISPGQVHYPVYYSNVSGYILLADSMLIKNEYKEIFEKSALLKSSIKLDERTINELKLCASLINNRVDFRTNEYENSLLHDLISFYIGLIAEVFQKGFPVIENNRYLSITSRFKKLLAENYSTLKRPSEYATKLNISAVYLNEAVKNTTDFTVSDSILNEIILQAKRLLYYTELSIKEIALSLGYEDWVYFTRLFTKATKLTPSQFRKSCFR